MEEEIGFNIVPWKPNEEVPGMTKPDTTRDGPGHHQEPLQPQQVDTSIILVMVSMMIVKTAAF
jgi:hypothetical protein